MDAKFTEKCTHHLQKVLQSYFDRLRINVSPINAH